MVLNYRDEKVLKIKNPTDEIEEFEILKLFPFSSDKKRMGIIVKNKNKIVFYVKGADAVMKDILNPGNRRDCISKCNEFASSGLRTLVIA